MLLEGTGCKWRARPIRTLVSPARVARRPAALLSLCSERPRGEESPRERASDRRGLLDAQPEDALGDLVRLGEKGLSANIAPRVFALGYGPGKTISAGSRLRVAGAWAKMGP